VEVLVILILFWVGAGVGLDVVRSHGGFWVVCEYRKLLREIERR